MEVNTGIKNPVFHFLLLLQSQFLPSAQCFTENIDRFCNFVYSNLLTAPFVVTGILKK